MHHLTRGDVDLWGIFCSNQTLLFVLFFIGTIIYVVILYNVYHFFNDGIFIIALYQLDVHMCGFDNFIHL